MLKFSPGRSFALSPRAAITRRRPAPASRASRLAKVAATTLVLASIPAPAHAAVVSTTGQLSDHVAEFVTSLPGRGSEAYDVPTTAEASTMASAYKALTRGEISKAASLAKPYRYDVVRFSDTATGRRFNLLQERRSSDGSYAHGWGLYVRSAGSTSALTVEVTHPRYDVHSADVGVAEFLRAAGADLFVAGAHRYANADGSADPAHRADSVFEAVHRSVLATGDRILQPHGFADDPLFGDLVVSAGVATPTPLIFRVAESLNASAFAVCVYDGDHCTGLGGTTNVQGASTRRAGAHFVHMEMSRSVRDSPEARARVVNAITPVLR